MDIIAFGNRVRAARERLGITQEDLAARVGMSPSHMSTALFQRTWLLHRYLNNRSQQKAAHPFSGVSCHNIKINPNCAGPYKHPSDDHICSGHQKLPCRPGLQSMLPSGLLLLHGF